MGKVALKHIIAEAQAELGLSDNSTTALFKVWAYDAQRSIGFSDLYKVEGDWQLIENNSLKKPLNLAVPISISLSSDKENCIEPVFNSDLEQCGCTSNFNSECEVIMGENETEFYFSSNAIEYKYGKIDYVSLPMDKEGNPLIDEVCAKAVKQYINYMHTRRQRKINRKSVPQSEVEAENNRWIRMKMEAIGNVNLVSPTQLKGIANKWLNYGITHSDIAFFNRLKFNFVR